MRFGAWRKPKAAFSRASGTLLWIVTLAALVAAALAVAATSATTVLERRAEIGVMKALGATNALVERDFSCRTGAPGDCRRCRSGFLWAQGFARFLGESVFGTPAAPRLILFPVVLALAAIIAMIGSLRSAAARRAFSSGSDSEGRVMFWRLVFQLLRGSRGRLGVAILAIVSGAAVISALLESRSGRAK